MIEFIDIIFNHYLRIFVGIILVGLVIFSLYYSYIDKLKKLLRFKTDNKDK
jgi:hypothetical protein